MFLDVNENCQEKKYYNGLRVCVWLHKKVLQMNVLMECFKKDGKFSKAKLCLLHSIQIFKGQKEARPGKMAQCSDPYYTGLWAWVSILSFHAKH